ncbi:MAG: CAP domain-containing protein [Actinomycetota bacterium]|nr:CAP domain-containing protein [Actinomycetota bacterium]
MKRRLKTTILLATAVAALAASASLAPVASAASCPKQNDAGASAAAQERAMLCLVNRARVNRGLSRLAAPSSLAWAADRKSADIIRCDEFSHEACGRESTYWAERSGYGQCVGENIAYASGRSATPRYIFKLWMNSQGHRENILRGSYDDIGIGLRVGEIDGVRGAHVWTQVFGIRGC